MKKLKYFMTLFAVAALFGGVSSVAAADAVVTNSTTNHQFTIKRSVTGVTNKVTNEFGYTVTASANNPDGASNEPTSGTVSFGGVTPTDNTATATGFIDFAGATYSKPGDYVYTVTETSTDNSTTYPLDNSKYTIKVSVRNGASVTDPKTIVINGYVGEGSEATKIADETSGSEQGGSGSQEPGQGGSGSEATISGSTLTFTSAAVFTDITISKTVEGNMADTSEYFKVKVTINGTSGDTYAITGQTYSGADKQTTYTVGQNNYVFLKHGETVTIGTSGSLKQVPKNITYSFEEQGATDYQTFIGTSTTNNKASGNLTTGDSNANTIKNTWGDESVITGAFLKVLPYVVIIAIAVAGVIYMVVRKKNKEANVEE